MSESNGRRKEWVKTAAIIFLTVMLLLTFFSNTIMNYSLPEVATGYITSGNITAKVRGTGTVESGTLYNVMTKESRKVKGVAVRTGDQVEIGDILFYLDDSESAELTAAREELKNAQNAYDMAFLSGSLSLEQMQNPDSIKTSEEYKQMLIDARKEVENCQAALDTQKADYDAAQSKVDTISLELTEINNKISNLQSWINYQNTISGGDATALTNQLLSEMQLQIAKQNDLNNAQFALQKMADVRSGLEKKLTEATEKVSDLTADINSAMQLESLYSTLDAAKKKVEKLEDTSFNATIKAEIAGTINSISVSAGQMAYSDTALAVIQPAGQNFTMSFSVSSDQAKRVSVGDPAELVNSWWYNDITAKVTSIKADPTNPSKQKIITFSLSGDLVAGQSLSLQVGQKTASYDKIVPNSAIREDNNGKFILVVESKSSPLGNRYYAVRYDVTVIASDDTRSAISSTVESYAYIITTSTKPIESGQLVRLLD